MTPHEMILFLPRGAAPSSRQKPLMLQSVLFCPLLTWVVQCAMDCQIRRFFLVCDAADQPEVLAALPAGTDAVCVDEQGLSSLLSSCSGSDVLLVNEPVVPMADGDPVCCLTAEEVAALGASPAKPGESRRFDALRLSPLSRFATWQELTMACQEEILRRHTENGVCVLDPRSVYLDPRVTVGAGTVLLPGTILRGNTSVGENCEIGPQSMLTDCTVGSGVVFNASQAADSIIEDEARIGPFTQLRPGSRVGTGAKIGDFVEIKNSSVGPRTSVAHLTYIGDCDVGEGVNFGCGTVVSNYDGAHKYRSSIGDRVFIGCNTNLISPVNVGSGAYIAAGSTITKDVPEDSLAIARVREQTNKEQWAAKRRAMLKSKF